MVYESIKIRGLLLPARGSGYRVLSSMFKFINEKIKKKI